MDSVSKDFWRDKLRAIRDQIEADDVPEWMKQQHAREEAERRRTIEEEARAEARHKDTEQRRLEAKQAAQEEVATRDATRREALQRLSAPGGIAGPGTPLGERYREVLQQYERARDGLQQVTDKQDRLKTQSDAVPIHARTTSKWKDLQDARYELKLERGRQQEKRNAARNQVDSVETEMLAWERRHSARAEREAFGVSFKNARPLTWRVLPPGHWKRLREEKGVGSVWWTEELASRLELLDSPGPLGWYEGSHLGQAVYFVAEFQQIALADAREYGNALYCLPVSRGDWRKVFCFDKQEARKAGARRLVHSGDWEARVRRLVKAAR